MNAVEDNIIQIQAGKEIASLYKSFLEIAEDLKVDHEVMMKKIAQDHGQAYADSINYFTHDKYEQLRKRILDKGNDSLRQLLSFLSFFDFVISKDRVEEAAKQKRVTVKKVIVSSPTIIE